MMVYSWTERVHPPQCQIFLIYVFNVHPCILILYSWRIWNRQLGHYRRLKLFFFRLIYDWLRLCVALYEESCVVSLKTFANFCYCISFYP